MLSVSSLIEFLLSLLRDDTARAAFDADPQGALTRHGLDGVTAQDIRDARPLLADHHNVRVRESDGGGHGGGGYSGGAVGGAGHASPINEIHYVTQRYAVDQAQPGQHGPDVQYVDRSTHVDRGLTVDNSTNSYIYNDNRTYIDNSSDTTITGDNATVIRDSNNQDNDSVVINGDVNDSIVSGDSTVASTNNATDTTTTVTNQDSFNHTEVQNDVQVEAHSVTFAADSPPAVPEPPHVEPDTYAEFDTFDDGAGVLPADGAAAA